jgi:hypothetical protein
MKNLKITLFSILSTLILFTSCTSNEPVDVIQPNTEESQSITTVLDQLSRQFDNDGNLNPSLNPSGNVVFDFCFNFIYPLDLSYNNGATVNVNGLNELIQILVNSTPELYISGIALPLDVEVYNENTNAIEIVTISNEQDFESLLEDCEFNDEDTCECYEIYEPVCVEINHPNGESFMVTYPNDCYAQCDGFDSDDIIEDCGDDYSSDDFYCFELNFPFSIITDNGEVIEVSSEEELNTVLYDVYFYDLVYPFSITLLENDQDETITINNDAEFEIILENCYDDDNGNDDDDNDNDDDNEFDCTTDEISTLLVNCLWKIDFIDFNEYIYNFNADSTFTLHSEGNLLTIGAWTLNAIDNAYIITLNAQLPMYNDQWIITDCDDENLTIDSLEYPQAIIYSIFCNDNDNGNNTLDCTTEEGIGNILTQCPWIIEFLGSDQYIYTFNTNGSYELSTANNIVTTGTWSITTNENTFYIVINAASSELSDEWIMTNCNEGSIEFESLEFPQADIYVIDCD